MKELKSITQTNDEQQAYSSNALAVQCSLAIGKTSDPLEDEANNMANQVMSMPFIPSTNMINKQDDANELSQHHSNKIVQRKPLSSFIQRKEANTHSLTQGPNTEQINGTKGSGDAMDSNTKSFMQNRFGADFSQVRIHTGADASQMSNELNANAFTSGNDIYFNEGQYRPNSSEGQHLLAHELTHTIQQGGEQKSIQRDEKDRTYSPKPDIDFKLLPPDFQLRLFHFLLQADTGKVHLDYHTRSFMAGLSYSYGDALSLNMKYREFSTKLGWVPGDNTLSLGLDKGMFSSKLSFEPGKQKFGLGLHYGMKLLPFQDQMTSTFMAGGTSFGNMMGGMPGAMNDPFAYYNRYKPDIENISKTADLVKDITEAGKSKIRFGADFTLTYDPVSQLMVSAKVGVMF